MLVFGSCGRDATYQTRFGRSTARRTGLGAVGGSKPSIWRCAPLNPGDEVIVPSQHKCRTFLRWYGGVPVPVPT